MCTTIIKAISSPSARSYSSSEEESSNKDNSNELIYNTILSVTIDSYIAIKTPEKMNYFHLRSFLPNT